MSTRLARSFAVLAIAVCATSSLSAQDTKTKSTEKPKSWVCKDGTTSTATGAAACAGHRGVDSIASKAVKDDAKLAKAEAKVEKAKKKGDTAKVAKADLKAKTAEAKAVKAEDKAAKDSAGATAKCKDGTYSHAKTTQGACSRHGGVAKTLKP